ncbi:metallophosphoesterase family protein [Vibrio variabilis]|uniref:metallophosphoesterase family protein n=1 Tax=Vibrio variabilis TaxID=990271 RepID=UPI000DDA2D16|nr:metallophosphoesterase [Vibrio variabilis]
MYHLKSLCAVSIALALSLTTGCEKSSSSQTTQPKPVIDPPHMTAPELKIGLLPDTQGGGYNVAIHPMEAVLKKHQAEGANMVIAVGDLTDNGSTKEWEQWTGVAEKYREAGIEFIPLMGNHETSYAYTVEWIENMRHFIPEDAIHMPGSEWLNYYVKRNNVLVIALAYNNLPVAFDWITEVIETNEGQFEHVVIASHNGLVGAKYGLIREEIVEGEKGKDLLFDIHQDIKELFAKHDVIWVQGHDHQYQRSQVHARRYGSNVQAQLEGDTDNSTLGSTPSGGNYRMPSYTQIITGNASYKGYEYRYGEREKIQDIIQHKVDTNKNGSSHFDVNAPMLTFKGDRVDYRAYSAPHTISRNEDGEKELADGSIQWQLMDQFTRGLNRCESIIYPNSIPEGQRPVLNHLVKYYTNHCVAKDGSTVQLVGGTNNTFNRIDSKTRSMDYTAGKSRAETMNDMMRLAHQFMYVENKAWDPNLNAAERVVKGDKKTDDTGAETGSVVVNETTIDMKEHVTVSWLEKTKDTLSDMVIISGMQVHGGTYQGAYGAAKNLKTDSGLAKSQPDGTSKAPVTNLPSTATQMWDVDKNIADTFGLEFTTNTSLNHNNAQLAHYREDKWQPLTTRECVVEGPWDESYIETPPQRPAACGDAPVVGYDSQYGSRWWVMLNKDTQLALIP